METTTPSGSPETYDAIIIGAGAAGDPLARALAQSGKKTLLIERGPWGGTCTNRGCTPSKTLEASARIAYLARTAKRWGVSCGTVSVSLPDVQKRVRAIQNDFRTETGQEIEQTPNLTVARADARFNSRDTVILQSGDGGETRATAPIIVINTGTRPAKPPVDGIDDVPFLTSDELLQTSELPRRLIVLGGNYIGVEAAQTFARFGSQVTLVESSPHILPQEDDDIAETLTKTLEAEGITFHVGAKAKQAAPHPDGVQVTLDNGTVLTGTHLLVATGRTPNTDTLNLEAAGVETDEQGTVTCGDDLGTSVPGIWAAGDVAGSPQFNHIAYDDYSILRSQLVGDKSRTRKGRLAPYVVYTDPPLGRVGLSEQQARDAGKKYRLATAPMTEAAYAIERGETDGLIKVLVEDETGLILGASILGLHGDETASLIHLAMATGATYTDLCNIPFAHPTLADTLGGLMRQVDDCDVPGTAAG